MVTMTTEDVRSIALDAAREAGYDGVDDADVTMVIDSLDAPSYSIRFNYDLPAGKPSVSMYVRLKRIIRDALVARGVDEYPYVSFVGRERWHRRSRA